MLASLFRKFWRDRRGNILLMFALMLPPMILAAGAAVDFSRLAASRAQLQAAVDGAALAGVGAYANEQNSSNATNVANTAFTSSENSISGAITLVGTPTVALGCTATSDSTQCGSGVTPSASACSSGTWCVTMTATARQSNPLFASLGRFGSLLSGENFTVSATAVWGAGTAGIDEGNTSQFGNFVQAQYSSGGYWSQRGIGWAHTSGLGDGSASSGGSSSGNAFFLDGFNNQAPSFLTYSSLPKPSNNNCTSSPIYGSGNNNVYLLTTNTGYCGLTLGNPPTEQWYYINGSASSSDLPTSWLNIPNGNLTVAPDTIICPQYLKYSSYTGTGVKIQANCSPDYNNANSNISGGYGDYTPIYLGGSLILGYNVSVTPATSNSGLLTFVNDEYDSINLLDSKVAVQEASYICPEGQTTCNNPTMGNGINVTGPSTYFAHDTYVTTVTVQNGIDKSWTETETFAVQYTQKACYYYYGCYTSTTQTTESTKVGGVFTSDGTTALNSVGPTNNPDKSTFSPSTYARDPTTDTNGVGDTDSSGNPTDAYGQLDTACTNYYNSTTGKSTFGGNKSVGGSTGPITVTGRVGNLFALTTDAPPSNTPPSAYNYTYPNYGYSYVNADEQGSALETETVYFCGTGSPLQVSNGSATGLTVSPSPDNGASLVN